LNWLAGDPYGHVKLPESALTGTLAGHPSFLRHTNRFPYHRDPLDDGAIQWITACAQGAARAITVSGVQSRAALASATRVCSEARFLTRELHEWLAGSLVIRSDRG
jgi:hypothetical protein